MNSKKISIAILIIGLICISSSIYIKSQVNEGKKEISSAQNRVNQGHSLFSIIPEGENISKEFSSPFQKKIDQGEQDIQKYESIAHLLTIAGIVCIVAGIGIFFIRKQH